eukprot:scaffold7439_cov168-Ochromonas_danica.AAC.11
MMKDDFSFMFIIEITVATTTIILQTKVVWILLPCAVFPPTEHCNTIKSNPISADLTAQTTTTKTETETEEDRTIEEHPHSPHLTSENICQNY